MRSLDKKHTLQAAIELVTLTLHRLVNIPLKALSPAPLSPPSPEPTTLEPIEVPFSPLNLFSPKVLSFKPATTTTQQSASPPFLSPSLGPLSNIDLGPALPTELKLSPSK